MQQDACVRNRTRATHLIPRRHEQWLCSAWHEHIMHFTQTLARHFTAPSSPGETSYATSHRASPRSNYFAHAIRSRRSHLFASSCTPPASLRSKFRARKSLASNLIVIDSFASSRTIASRSTILPSSRSRRSPPPATPRSHVHYALLPSSSNKVTGSSHL
jgi:hypothetical protein